MPSTPRRKPARSRREAGRPSGRKPAASRAAVMRKLAPITRLCETLKTTRARRGPALDAAATSKAVTFSCNNAGAVLVTITTQAGALLLQPSVTFTLPTATQTILWSARGAAGSAFAVSVSGGSLDVPISGPLPSGGDGGLRVLTVS